MCRRAPLVTILIVFVAAQLVAKTETWLEVRSPHFTVLTNSGKKQARHTASQFERMRDIFREEFPDHPIDAGTPIRIIAVRDGQDFRALEPEAYLKRGQLDLAGLFLRGPDKNYVLLRLDAQGEHPFSVIYHEYTHFVLRRVQGLPLWLNEGLAQFYQNTVIGDEQASVGGPDEAALLYLNEKSLLPLPTLFAVDYNSPYYHEEDKGSIFYAESWALAHYLKCQDMHDHTVHLSEYALLVGKKVDPVQAASQAFGDLKSLDEALRRYIRQRMYYYYKVPVATLDEAAFQMKEVTLAEADAMRADFLAYDGRLRESRALLEHVLNENPNDVGAVETMGFLYYREGNLDDAARWYEQAVKLDSKNFLAHYYFGSIAMRRQGWKQRSAEIENSLLESTKLNPEFGPAFDQLAAFYGMERKNLDEAAMLNLRAVALEPANVVFRTNRANLMMAMGRPTDAIAVPEGARKIARPEEIGGIDKHLESIRRFEETKENLNGK